MQNSNLWAVLWKHWELPCEHKGGWKGIVPMAHPGLWGAWHCSDTWDTHWDHPGDTAGASEDTSTPCRVPAARAVTETDRDVPRHRCPSLPAPSGQAAGPGAIQAGDKHWHTPQHNPEEPGHPGQVLQGQEVGMLPQNPAPGQAELTAAPPSAPDPGWSSGKSQFCKNSVLNYSQKNMPALSTKWLFKGWRL